MEKNEEVEATVNEFEKLINTPLSEEDARKKLAECDIQTAQLGAIRMDLAAKIANIDLQLAQADLDRKIIYRQVLAAGSEEKK